MLKLENKIKKCDLVVTENCMLSCKMCHMWKHKNNDEQISLEDYCRFFDSLRDCSGKGVQLQFIGGEPLLKKDVLKLVGHASRDGFNTTMTTNGFLVDENMSKMIRDCGLNTLGFSLESINNEKHDFLRGIKGVHEKVTKALDYFTKYPSPDIFIATIINEYNLDDLVNLAEWVNKNKRVNFIYYQALMQPFGMQENENWYNLDECKSLWPKDLKKVEDILDRLIYLKSKGYMINNHPGQLEAFKSYFRNPLTFIKKREKCNIGNDAITVLPNGNIFLCLAKKPIGNIKKDRIEDIWFSSGTQDVRDEIANCKNNCKLVINCFFEEEKNECDKINE